MKYWAFGWTKRAGPLVSRSFRSSAVAWIVSLLVVLCFLPRHNSSCRGTKWAASEPGSTSERLFPERNLLTSEKRLQSETAVPVSLHAGSWSRLVPNASCCCCCSKTTAQTWADSDRYITLWFYHRRQPKWHRLCSRVDKNSEVFWDAFM